jgi:c-di-GMP-binding flagellar brake protein YcgR
MQERRRETRQLAKDYLFVWNREDESLVGQVANLTASGAMLLSNDEVKPGALLRCRMTMPQPIDNVDFIEFEAESRWCEKNDRSGVYRVGLQFSSISTKHREILSQLIKSWKEWQPAGTQA